MNVIVKRAEWYRGQGSDFSRLLVTAQTFGDVTNSSTCSVDIGKKCCLGFTALAAGYSESEIADKESPVNLSAAVNILPNLVCQSSLPGLFGTTKFIIANSDVCHDMMVCNDNPDDYTEPEREEELIVLGATIGINFIFVD